MADTIKIIPSFVQGNTTILAVKPKWEDMDAKGGKTLTDADLAKVSDMSVSVVTNFGKRYEMDYKLIDDNTFSIDLVNLSVGTYGLEVKCVDEGGLKRRFYAAPGEWVRIVSPTSAAEIPTDGTVNNMYDMSIVFSLVGASGEALTRAEELLGKANDALTLANEAKATADGQARTLTETNVSMVAAETARLNAEQRRETVFELSKLAAETAASNANAATEKVNTVVEKARAVVEDYKQNMHEHLTITLTTDNDNDGALKGAIVSIKYQNAMDTARVDTLTWDGEPLKTDITAGMMYTVSASKVSGYDYVEILSNITAVGGYDRSVTLRYANAIDKEMAGQIYINPSSGSSVLQRKNVKMLNVSLTEYRSKGFPCVMDAGGNKLAKIKSATFEGNYSSGMTEGTVTFMDGTICDIDTLNAKGCNWMVYRPELFFNSWVNDTMDEVLSFGGNMRIRGGHSFREKYVGMFKAFNQDGVLKSQPNRIPANNQTIAMFQQQAEIGGKGYCLWSYKDWCKENALHISLFGNTNYEVNIGTGRINNYDRIRNIVTGFTLPLVGTERNYGTRSTLDSNGNLVNCLNFLDIEGMGEQIWEFVIGYRHDAGTIYIWDDDTWSESHDADYTVPYSINSAANSYVRQMVAGEHFDMIPRALGGSSVTGYCDGYWASTSGRALIVGGFAGNGSFCGLSNSASNNGFNTSISYLGARLAFSDHPVEVKGAKLLE